MAVFIVTPQSASHSFRLHEAAPASLPDGRQASVLGVCGRLDGSAQAECDRELAERVAAGATCFILDCGDLEFVSSAGVRCFIKLIKLTRPAGGGVVICRPRAVVRQVVELAGLGDLLPVAEDLAAAVRRF
jgi:anti-sigma B factor antagonist